MMNRIYKVIFNTSLGLYQVVSEIARNHGKSSSGTRTGRKSVMVPFIVAALLALPVGIGALAANTDTSTDTQTNTVVTVKDGDQLQGKGAAVVSSTTTTTITINVPNDGKVESGNNGLVTGGTVYSEVRPATDGTYVKTSQTTAHNLTNLDTQVGTNTGDITKLKDLSNLTDAGQKVIQTASQNAVKVAAGTNIKVDSSTADDGSKTYTVSAEATGKVAKGDTGLVSGDTVNTAITNAVSNASTAADTKLLKKADVDAGNIGKNLKNADGSAVATSEEVTANEKAWGTAIGTGSIAAPSGMLITDTAVHDELRPAADGTYVKAAQTTSQNLTALDTQVVTNTSDITKLKDLSNISETGTTVIKQRAKQAVKVAADGNASVTMTGNADDGNTLTYTIHISSDGTVTSNNTGLISGGTLYSELRPDTDGTYVKTANTTAVNLLALDTNLANVINAMGLDINDTKTSYTSKLNKYFKVNPEFTTNDDGTKTYATDAAANGTNSVAIGPNAKTAQYTTTTTSGDTTTTTETAADHAVAIGDGATVNAAGDKGLAIGNGASVGEAESTTTSGTTTTTTDAKGGASSAAIGDSAKANGNTSVALGANAQVLNTTDHDGKTTATIEGSTAIGSGAKVNGASDAAAIGTKAQVNETATGGIAFGKGAVTGEDKGTVTVSDVTANVAAVGGENSVALGTDAKASGNTALALGKGAQVNNYTTQSGTTVTKTVNSGSTAIGSGAVVTGADDAVALGTGASVTGTGDDGDDSMAIGKGASVATAKDAMALGTSAAVASGANNAVAIGNTAKANTANTTAIGYNASATGAGAIAIGENTATSTEGGISIGSGTSVSGRSIAIGYSTDGVTTGSDNTDAVAIGNGAQAYANDSISIGHQAGKGTNEGRTSGYGSLIAIGTNAGANVKGMQNVAMGSGAGSNVKSSYNVAIGSNAGSGINYAAAADSNPQDGYNISIGYEANYQSADANAKNIKESIAIGHSANAVSEATALGTGATASGDKSMALGYNAAAADTDSIALGDNASAGGGNIAIGSGSQAPAITAYTSSYLTNNTTLNGYISVGGKTSATGTTVLRRISNVADGSADQDAVTVAQLKNLETNLAGTIQQKVNESTSETYNKTAIDSKIADVTAKIQDAGTKYFSINPSSDTLTANEKNDGASTSGAADAMAIGPNATATSAKAVAIGNNVSASGKGSIALGTADNPATSTTGTEGGNTSANPHVTSAEGANSVAIGTSAIAQTDNSVALGTRASVYTSNVTDTATNTTVKVGQQSIAIGYESETRNSNATSIGSGAKAYSDGSTAIGHSAYAQGADSVVIGTSSTANGASSGIVGKSNTINGSNTYAVGSENNVNGNWGAVTYSGLYGSKNNVNPVSDTSGNTKHGMDSLSITGNSNTISQGSYSDTVQNISILGNSNSVTGANTDEANAGTTANITVIGGNNEVTGRDGAGSDYMGKTWNQLTRTSIIGYGNIVNQAQSTISLANTQILGNDVTATLGNSVYLGTGAAAKTANLADATTLTDAEQAAVDALDTTGMTDAEKATAQANAKATARYATNLKAMKASGTTAGLQTLNTDTTYDDGTSYTYDDGTSYTYAGSSPVGVITVGSAGSERRIQNVAAGLVSATSTDAVNGSQLYALTRQIRFGGDNSTFGKTTAADDKNVVARGSNETISITGGSDAVKSSTTDGTTTYTVDAAKLTGNNIAVVADKDANALHVQLASNLKDLNTAQLGSGSGDSYKETIKLDGTDTTNGGTLELKDATGANGVTLRTSGTTTTADVNGTATTRLLVNDKTVATTDDGLKFGGDTENTSALKLNSKLTIKGGADTTKLTDNNIGVVSAGNGTLTVKLSKNVNLGMDGSLTTGTVTATAVTADTVTSGNSTLNTNGLTITNGPSVLATGINAGSKKITNVSDGEANADAANYGQVKAAKTTLSQGNNNVTITPNTASEDGHTNYTVSVSNLYYKAGTDTTAKDVALATGLTFNNGKNTTAVAGDNGIITYNLNDKIELGAETDSNNHIVVDGTQGLLTLGMDATINGNAGTASIGGVSIGKAGTDRVITGLTNKTWTVGTTQAVDGRAATENQLQSVADNLNTANTNIATLQHGFKVQVNGDTTTESTVKADDALNFTAGDNAKVTTTKNSKQITISVDNLSVKDNNGTAQSVKLAEGLNFQDGTNTTAKVGTSGTVTYDLKDSITLGNSTDETNRIIVNGTNGTITAGNLATINGNAGTASIGGVSIGKSGNDQTVTGLSNRTWVVGESTAVNGRAATEDQLQSVSNAAHTNADNITTLQQGFTVTANNDNDKKSTIKAGDKLNFQAGKNVQVSTTADSKSIEVALSDTPEFTTVTAKDANGNITTVSGTGVTITPTGTGTQSVSLTSEGLDNGNHVIRNVASGGTVRTNAANIGDLQDAISNASTTTTNTGFNVKGDDATAQKVKLGKQLNVVGGTTDSTQLSTGNIGVETTADAEGNATLTVKLKKDIALDSVTTGSTTLNTSGVTNGNMSLTATGMTITNTDASKQVSVTTSGVSMGSQRIQNVGDAAQDTDAATLGQVKKARTVVAGGSNVDSVTPAEGANNQMTYTVNVDNLSVKANTEAPKSVTLKKGLTFNNGTNTTASVSDDGEVKYDLNSTLTGLTSVTAGNSTLNTNGLTIKDGAATKVEITSGNVTMGGNVIHNVGAGQVGTDAVNKDQLDALQNQVSGGWNLAGYNAEGTTVTAKIGAGKTVTYGDGNYTKSVVTKDDSTGNATVKVDVTTGTFGSGTGDKAGTVISTTNGLATTQDVASAINSASISVVADNTPENKTAVKAGDTIHFAKDENLTLTQNGTTFTYGLNKEISISKVTTSDTTKGSTVQTAEGVTTTDAAGNTYIQNGQGITLTPSDKTKSPVKLTNTGLNNGGNKITGVGKGTDDTDAVNVSQLEEVQKQVGSGWQIADNNGTKVADIGAGRKVSFKTDSQYLTAKTETAGTDAANVTYGLKTKALEAASGKVSSVDTAEDGLATAKNVADTINQTYWTAASGKSGSGSQTDETTNAADKQISAGDTVTFNAGNNLSLIQNGAFFTYGLQTDLTGMNTITFTPRSDTDGRSISLVIGKQKDGVNTDEGYYITGLDKYHLESVQLCR